MSAGTISRRFLVVCEGIPRASHGGGALTAYSVVLALLQQGHTVGVTGFAAPPDAAGRDDDIAAKHLSQLGVELHLLPPLARPQPGPFWHAWGRHLHPGLSSVFPGALAGQAVEQVSRLFQPDAVFAYHWNSLAATRNIQGVPRLGAVGDPAHLPGLMRRELARSQNGPTQSTTLTSRVCEFIHRWHQRRWMRTLLNECDACGAFAAHHAAGFRSEGVTGCQYLRTPLPDPLPQTERPVAPGRFRALHIGHLRGTATVAGLDLLVSDILPELDRVLGCDGYELHLVGGYYETLPERIRHVLNRPNVAVRGQVFPPDPEFLNAHVVLVPTPIRLGIRVRIVTALSFGSCVVAHVANRDGIPELAHDHNCLIGVDGKSVAAECIRAARDPELRRRVAAAGRATYEECFSLTTAGGAIEEILLRLAAKRSDLDSSRQLQRR